MSPPAVTTSNIVIGIGSVVITILGTVIWKIWHQESIPKKWRKVGRLKELYIFPLKSGTGIKKRSLYMTVKGVKEYNKTDGTLEMMDRMFLVYNRKHNEIRTARQIPRTVLVGIRAAKNGVILSAPGMDDIFVGIPKVKNNVKIKFTKETYIGTDCGDEVGRWLSRFLQNTDEGLGLAYGNDSVFRDVIKAHNKWAQYYTKMDNQMSGVFTDLAALHLCNQSTVDDLNKHLSPEDQVTFLNFRPNFLIEGPEAFEEDHWEYVKVGDIVAKVCLECLRCIETTVNPKGVMNKNREPQKTLEAYRLSNSPFKSGVMGIYLKIVKPGIVNEGDEVYVSESA